MSQGVKSVTVTLKAGVTAATLPNNVRMRAGVGFAISLDDWAKIAREARLSVLDATMNTKNQIVPMWDGTNYALDLDTITNKASIALVNSDAQAQKDFFLGEVVQGFNGTAFKLVKVDAGSATVAAGTSVAWGGDTETVRDTVVTSDLSDLTDDDVVPVFAGIAIATITAGQFGWIQIEGKVEDAKVEANVAAGEPVALSANTDERLTSVTSEVQSVEVTGASAAEQFKIKFTGGADSVAILWNATATVFKAALEDLAEVDGTEVTVTGDGSNATPFLATFDSSLGDLPVLTEGAQVGSDTVGLTVAEVTKGNAGLGDVVGSALTAAGSNLCDVELRTGLFARRHVRTKNLFFDKN